VQNLAVIDKYKSYKNSYDLEFRAEIWLKAGLVQRYVGLI